MIIYKERKNEVYVSMAHIDDLSFNVNGMDAQTYGSQGQQRTTALSIVGRNRINEY